MKPPRFLLLRSYPDAAESIAEDPALKYRLVPVLAFSLSAKATFLAFSTLPFPED